MPFYYQSLGVACLNPRDYEHSIYSAFDTELAVDLYLGSDLSGRMVRESKQIE